MEISHDEKATYKELLELSHALSFPISHLLEDTKEATEVSVLFRKGFVDDQENAINEKFNLFVENILAIKPDLDKIESVRSKIKTAENTYKNAQIMASLFREYYFKGNHVDPLTELPSILANDLGMVVKVLELGKNIDGASAYIDGLTFLFVSPRFEGRMLFTVAHELGHILNHHKMTENSVYIDKKISFRPRHDKHNIERFANAFASSLLLPIDGTSRMLKKIRELQKIRTNSQLGDVEIFYLARYYGVSFDVAAQRCEDLGLLPEYGAFSLAQQIKKDYGSAEKRANELGLSERAKVVFPEIPNFILDKAVELVKDENYSIGKIAEMLSVPVNLILNHHAKVG